MADTAPTSRSRPMRTTVGQGDFQDRRGKQLGQRRPPSRELGSCASPNTGGILVTRQPGLEPRWIPERAFPGHIDDGPGGFPAIMPYYR